MSALKLNSGTTFKKFILVIGAVVLTCVGLNGYAQQRFSLKVTVNGRAEQKIIDDYQRKNAIVKQTDSATAYKIIQACILKLNEQGYLTASADSIVQVDSTITAYIYPGNIYRWAKLEPDSASEHIARLASPQSYARKIFTPSQLAALHKNILTYCENNGYPYASSQLSNVVIGENTIAATLDVQLNQMVRIDSIIVEGNAKISKVILYNYLYLSPGDPYNESLIKKVPLRIREINFVKEDKPLKVVFTQGGCYLVLYLSDKKSSQVDGIIGVLPADNKGGKTTVTGEVRLRLQNSFAHAELIDFHWQQAKAKTQDLNIRFVYPFLFKSPFGTDAGLNIHKQDTTYLDVKGNIGINYFVSGGNYIKFFVESERSSLLNTKGLENSTSLPPYADIKKQTFGLGYKKEQLDYRYNPRRGYAIEATAGAGTRTIEKNSKIDETLYDSVDLKTAQYKGVIELNTYFQLGGRHVLNIGASGGGLINKKIFINELFLIGGLKSLRGFDEQSIQASQYVIGKAEYRFILDQGSYLLAFFNAAYYENRVPESLISDHPLGFGAGLSFESKLGIFSFNYALGKQFNNPIYIRAAKIHFGIINYF